MKKKYKATKGAPFPKENAQRYGESLNKMAMEKNGTVTPHELVNGARDEDSVFHDYFDWDNNNAGEKYRIHQARQLINHINIVVKYNDGEKEQKAFFSVFETPNDKEKNTTYVTMERVLSEPELRNQILRRALNEVDYWQQKYFDYNELSKIFTAIKVTKKKLVK